MTPAFLRPRRSGRPWPVLALALAAAACGDDGGTDPGTLRFGQVGEARLRVETPLALGAGALTQHLVWQSDGLWTLEETVSYDGVQGDTDRTTLSANQEVSAGLYAQWIAQVNQVEGLNLFVPELDPFLEPSCTNLQSRVTLTIRDDARDEQISWTRCAQGPISQLTPVGAGPDPAASRVVNASVLLRGTTVGDAFTSIYIGTVPFATIDRGEDSGAPLTGPRVIRDAAAWAEFWSAHSRSQGAVPPVDFGRDMVLVGSVGLRQEAGDSVEVRRVLVVQVGTVVELTERVPGNFCSPAEKRHIPFHIVRVPKVPDPVRYGEIQVVRVPCG